MSDALLSTHNLRCERGYRTLFEHLDLHIERGELLQIGGENGSGKSTLLKVLAGLSSDFGGEIFWQNRAIHQVKEQFHADLCYLGHAKGVKQGLSIRENLRWFCSLYPCDDSADAQRQVLEQLRLYRYRDYLCGQLSAGQQQRVALARLLLSRASLWILDEPFTAIDKQGVAEFEQIICQRVSTGTAVILTTHHTLQLAIPHRSIVLGG